MKKLIILLGLFPFIAFSQVADWYGSDLSRLGYKSNKISFETEQLSYTKSQLINGQVIDSSFTLNYFKGGNIDFGADLISKNIYFSLDGTFFIDLLVDYILYNPGKPTRKTWKHQDIFTLETAEIFPLRLAFGRNITPYFAIYAGGQYSYSIFTVNDFTKTPSQNYVMLDGHTYGLGAHAVGAYKFVKVRYSYMYNWTNFYRGFKGNRIDQELAIYVGAAQLGGFIKLNNSLSMTHEGYLFKTRTYTSKHGLSSDTKSWQESQYGLKNSVSVGIYMAGLFSGISKGGAYGVGSVEEGLYRERQEQKRRTIRYIED